MLSSLTFSRHQKFMFEKMKQIILQNYCEVIESVKKNKYESFNMYLCVYTILIYLLFTNHFSISCLSTKCWCVCCLQYIDEFVTVVVLCASPDSVREIMIKAHELNFDNGEYVFFNIDLFTR